MNLNSPKYVLLIVFLSIFLAIQISPVRAQDFPIEAPTTDDVDLIEVAPPLKIEQDRTREKKSLNIPSETAQSSEQLAAANGFGISLERRVGIAATPMVLFGIPTPPGERRELSWSPGDSFASGETAVPVIVLNGSVGGPRVCLTAAIHGDELNGVEIVRRLSNEIDLKSLNGTVIAIPIVNLFGFNRNSRYLPDRRDLNRYFPGRETGSIAARIAHRFFNQIVVHCDALIDFHTGSFERANLPQVRGDLTETRVREFTRSFGATAVLHSPGSTGMLRVAANALDIPAVTFEVGAPMRLEPDQINAGVQAVHSVLHKLGMTKNFRIFGEPQAFFYRSKWVRANAGGMLFAEVNLGDRIRVGQRLGKVIDPIANTERDIVSPVKGRVIGMALNQIVLPGFAAFHVGVETSMEGAAKEAEKPSVDPLENMEDDELAPRIIRERDAVENNNLESEENARLNDVIDQPAPK